MKTTITLITAMLLLMMAGCTQSKEKKEEVPVDARYPFKSAIIEQKSIGTIGDSEAPGRMLKKTYVDDYGTKESAETEMYDFDELISHVLEILTPAGKHVLLVDLTENTASYTSEEEIIGIVISKPEDLKDYKKVGEETVAGKLCKVYQSEPQEPGNVVDIQWIWQDIVLRRVIVNEIMSTGFEITSIELNVPIPPEKFEIPKGIKIEESPDE